MTKELNEAHEHICPSCKYSETVFAGTGVCMSGSLETFTCHKCQCLFDAMTYRLMFPEPGEIEIKDIKCLHCRSSQVEKWDAKKKPCPKCGTKMTIKPDGLVILYD